MMLNSLNFELGETFTVRFPARPVDVLIKNLNEFSSKDFDRIQLIKTLLEDQEFVFNIKTASPSLFSNLENLEDKNNKQLDGILQSLIKYYKRFNSRPTPFSLFSSVAIGKFDDVEFPQIAKSNFNYRIRISEEWLNGFIQKLQNDLNILPFLELKTNDLLIEENSTYYLAYYTSSDADEKTSIKEVNLKKTNLLEYTLNFFESSKEVNRFLSVLNEQGIDEKAALQYLQNLLNKEYLISNLRISNSVEEKISELSSILKNLGEVALPYFLFLESLNLTELDEAYLEKEKIMKEYVDVKECYQIDSFYSEPLNLPMALRDELLAYSKVMYKIGTILDTRDKVIDYYLSKFIDYYGINLGVPIKTLINDKTELGPPPTYLNPTSILDFDYYQSKSFQQANSFKFISELIALSMKENSDEIDIQDLLDNYEIKEAELKEGSADIYVSIYEEDNGYRLYPSGNIFSPLAGRTAGRFLYGLPKEYVGNFLKKQKEDLLTIESDVELVNVTINPFIPRSSNVMKAPTDYDYEISISSYPNSSKELIDLEDIYVYTDGERIRFYSRSLQKDLKFTISHMLNHQMNTPNIYRFMIDVEFYKNFSTQAFYWGIFDNKPVLPRVKSGNIIIHPKSWNMHIKDKKEAEDYVNHFVEKYKLPRYLKIVNYDNFILIDLNFKYSKDILVKELISKKQLRLVEANELYQESILKDGNNHLFANEIVFSIYVRKDRKQEIQLQGRPKQISIYDPKMEEERYPKNWFYIKLYNNMGKDTKILSKNLVEFYQKINGIGEAFYIKYADPKPHIRLRVKYSEDNKGLVQQYLDEFIEQLFNQRLIYDVAYTRYKREIERYGGPQGIRLAEEVFSNDSLLATQMLSFLEENIDVKYKFLIKISTIMLEELIEGESTIQWMENNYNLNKKYFKEYRKEVKENKNKMIEIQQAIDTILSSAIGVEWKDKLRSYKNFINEFEANEYFIASMLHMHLNRLGIHNSEEEKVINMVYYHLKEESFKAVLIDR